MDYVDQGQGQEGQSKCHSAEEFVEAGLPVEEA